MNIKYFFAMLLILCLCLLCVSCLNENDLQIASQIYVKEYVSDVYLGMEEDVFNKREGIVKDSSASTYYLKNSNYTINFVFRKGKLNIVSIEREYDEENAFQKLILDVNRRVSIYGKDCTIFKRIGAKAEEGFILSWKKGLVWVVLATDNNHRYTLSFSSDEIIDLHSEVGCDKREINAIKSKYNIR